MREFMGMGGLAKALGYRRAALAYHFRDGRLRDFDGKVARSPNGSRMFEVSDIATFAVALAKRRPRQD